MFYFQILRGDLFENPHFSDLSKKVADLWLIAMLHSLIARLITQLIRDRWFFDDSVM